MQYRREIDGLRAIAVLPVIFFHAGFDVFSGGYVGVDVFFVISGFLITRILLNEQEAGTFTLTRFYQRRARRILPALFFVILCCIPFAWYWMLPSQHLDFSRSLIAVLLFASNFLFWKESGYFAAAAEEKPLLHTWSLAVEEQYYVFFPLFIMLCWRLGRMNLAYLIALGMVLSLTLSEYAARHFPGANFYLAPTRAWELLAGSLTAFALHQRQQESSTLFSGFGLILIVASILLYDDGTRWPSIYTLSPVLGTVLLILYTTPNTWVYRILASPPLVGIGLISYSAYLWHQPLLAFARIRTLYEPSHYLMGGLALLSLLLAAFTWRYIETPFRRPANSRSGRMTIASLGVLSLSLVLGMGLHGHLTQGNLEQWQRTNPEKALTYQRIREAREEARFSEMDERSFSDCVFRVNRLDRDSADRLAQCKKRFGPGIAVLGDSHAIDLFFGLALNNTDYPFMVGISRVGCRPHTQDRFCHYSEFLKRQQKQRYFSTIIFEQAGFYLLEDARNNISESRSIFQDVPLHVALSDIHVHPDNIQSVTDYLEKLSGSAQVVWLGPRIEHHIPDKLFIDGGCEADYSLREGTRDVFNMLDQTLLGAVNGTGSTALRYISQSSLYAFDPQTDLINCDEVLWSDGDHWSASGERYFGRLIMRGLIEAGALPSKISG